MPWRTSNTNVVRGWVVGSHLQVVVHEELQDEIAVTLVRLEDFVHDGAVLQQVGGPLHHEGVVEVDLDEGVLLGVVAVHGNATDLEEY